MGVDELVELSEKYDDLEMFNNTISINKKIEEKAEREAEKLEEQKEPDAE